MSGDPRPGAVADADANAPSGANAAPDPVGPDGDAKRVLWAATALLLCVALVALIVGLTSGRHSSVASAAASVGNVTPANPHGLPSIPSGRPAPGFQLPRLGGGPVVSSGADGGTPLVVNFFASWCPNCVDELKNFAAASAGAQGRVDFVGVDSNDTDQSAARKLLAQSGVHYPVGLDSTANTAVAYSVVALPTTVFIDRHGRIVGEAFGTQSLGQLRSWILRLEASA